MPLATSNKTIGKPFTEFSVIDSTNNYAMAQAKTGQASHGSAWFAHYQSGGKGQRGKSWQAAEGENILLSVLLNTNRLSLKDQFYLIAAASLAAYDFFSFYAGDATQIKWPNDIYWNDRKAGGILIENIIRGHNWQWAVVGFGININQKNFDLSQGRPVSLLQISGKTFPVVELAKELCNYFESRFEQIFSENKFSIIDEYNSVLYKKNQIVRLKEGHEIFDCTILGVNEQGALKIEKGAEQRKYNFGEVEWTF